MENFVMSSLFCIFPAGYSAMLTFILLLFALEIWKTFHYSKFINEHQTRLERGEAEFVLLFNILNVHKQ